MAILQPPPKHHLLSTTEPTCPSPNLLHLSPHLPLKLCTYPAPSPAHGTDHPCKYYHAFLPCTFAYAVPRTGMLFVPHIEETILLPQVPFTPENLIFSYNLLLSVQNTSLCASIIALHFASYYNSFFSLLYYNLRVRISYHLFLKFSYQYFSKCSH